MENQYASVDSSDLRLNNENMHSWRLLDPSRMTHVQIQASYVLTLLTEWKQDYKSLETPGERINWVKSMQALAHEEESSIEYLVYLAWVSEFPEHLPIGDGKHASDESYMLSERGFLEARKGQTPEEHFQGIFGDWAFGWQECCSNAQNRKGDDDDLSPRAKSVQRPVTVQEEGYETRGAKRRISSGSPERRVQRRVDSCAPVMEISSDGLEVSKHT